MNNATSTKQNVNTTRGVLASNSTTGYLLAQLGVARASATSVQHDDDDLVGRRHPAALRRQPSAAARVDAAGRVRADQDGAIGAELPCDPVSFCTYTG